MCLCVCVSVNTLIMADDVTSCYATVLRHDITFVCVSQSIKKDFGAKGLYNLGNAGGT